MAEQRSHVRQISVDAGGRAIQPPNADQQTLIEFGLELYTREAKTGA